MAAQEMTPQPDMISGSAAWGIRIVSVAVTAGDAAIPIVDAQFGALITAYFAPAINGLRLGVKVAASAFPSAALHIPAASWVRYYMV